MTGRVLKSVFWLMNAIRPAFQFFNTSVQMIGLVPARITLNILLKVMYEAPNEPITIKTKIIFSRLDSNYYELSNDSISLGIISRTSPITA